MWIFSFTKTFSYQDFVTKFADESTFILFKIVIGSIFLAG